MITDFHTHILPRIDDGSSSVNESIKMLYKEAEQGVDRVILTPHFYPQSDDPENFLKRRDYALYQLSEAIKTVKKNNNLAKKLPEIIVGAEVFFYQGMSESTCLRDLCIGSSRYLLVEMPPEPWPESAYKEIEAIHRKQRIIPIIAHIDRYIKPFRTYHIPEKLADMHVLVQVNASALLTGVKARQMIKLIKQDKIHLLGSDCHNITTRKPNMKEAVEKIMNTAGIEAFHRISSYEREVVNP